MPGEYSSPLHPRALTSKELTFNRIVVLFNIYLGVLGEYCVVSTPENQERTIGNVAVISLKVLKTGVVIEYPLVNLGAQPYEDGSWNKAHFIIDRQFMSE